MRTRTLVLGVTFLATVAFSARSISAASKPPEIKSIARPVAGHTQIIFNGPPGPFMIQKRPTLTSSAWVDMPDAIVTELQPGVYLGQFPNGLDDLGFYRILSQSDGIAELKGWTVLVRVSNPANGSFFARGESPVVTVTILDTFARGYSRTDFSTLNLYMHGPQDPRQTVTASKMLNASTDRTKRPHHYIDLRTNTDVKINGTQLSYTLKPVTDEAPGTYTVSVWSVLAADPIQQIMKFVHIQIGDAAVEQALVEDASGVSKCASCHLGPTSGRLYMHHIDPGFSPTGNWSLDYAPVHSCKSCHNKDGYAAYSDASATGGLVSDPIVRRVHGVHMGEELSLPFNTNSVNGSFRNYTDVVFPADIRNCTKCHIEGDDRIETHSSRLACGSCHDNVWFGDKTKVPEGMKMHTGLTVTDDSKCLLCHSADGLGGSVADSHKIPPPAMDVVSLSLTPPANGKFYVAGEKPVVTIVIKDDNGNPIDHTKVTDANFSTASLFVYGPRTLAKPVLTSVARNVNSKLRASVSSSVAGPWPIKGKVFKIAVNGNPPQNITITGASNLVTAAEVVNSLNAAITNQSAKATVSGTGVNIKTTIQGELARFEIYSGEVTTAMGWKRAPNTTMDPDVTIAAGTTPSNDLRALSDPLDYADPMVTRAAAAISYQLDDVGTLAPGTYGIYVYHLPKAGKIANLAAPTGIGNMMFQVGNETPDKKIATNCTDCHGNTIFHLAAGPIHPAPFNTDYCVACHDYGHTAIGEAFKNQGGTSLSGWSGFGAVPIVRRVHGVHFAHYLEHSEEIYANATKETFGGIIFPQDVRNCTKCHAERDEWKQAPSRLACLACHDSDAAKTHAKLMTDVPDRADPYGPLSEETCIICHGRNAEFSADKVHDIASPYIPPYPRE